MSKQAPIHPLARAFLAGEANFESIIERAARLLGKPWRQLRPLARRYLRLFGNGSIRPRRRDVAAFLQSERLPKRLSVADWLTEPQRMQPIPAALTWNIPPIESAGALAGWLGLAPTELDWFADLKALSASGKLAHYHHRFLPKPAGGVRIIEAPKPHLKSLQRQILTGIIDHIPPHPAAHGFRKGRNIQTFAAPHVAQRVVLRMDLEDFFPTISGPRIQTLFRAAGYPESVADLLGGLCSSIIPRASEIYRRPHLPQGAPTSPALANLCAYRLDCRFTGLAQSAGAVYTRYADDLAFSGGDSFHRSVERFLLHAAAIATEEGFTINHRKSRVMRQGVRQHLAGLVINRKINVMRPDYDRLKAILTNCIRLGPASQNRDNHPSFRQHLEGRVAFVGSVNASKGRSLRALLAKINW